MSYEKCPREDWSNGKRKCPHGCGVDYQRNAKKQREHGKRIVENIKNYTKDDWQWLAGTGPYG